MPVAPGASTSLRFQAGRQQQGLALTPLATQAGGLCVRPRVDPRSLGRAMLLGAMPGSTLSSFQPSLGTGCCAAQLVWANTRC